MSSNSVVLGIVLVVLMSFFVGIVDLTIPIVAKLRFDEVCRNYAVFIAAEGELTSEEKIEFKNELEKIGIDEIEIELSNTEQLRFNEDFQLDVRGILTFNTIKNIFQKGEEKVPCHYTLSIRYRKYTN